jgi:hypothetical protein
LRFDVGVLKGKYHSEPAEMTEAPNGSEENVMVKERKRAMEPAMRHKVVSRKDSGRCQVQVLSSSKPGMLQNDRRGSLETKLELQ